MHMYLIKHSLGTIFYEDSLYVHVLLLIYDSNKSCELKQIQINAVPSFLALVEVSHWYKTNQLEFGIYTGLKLKKKRENKRHCQQLQYKKAILFSFMPPILFIFFLWNTLRFSVKETWTE